MRTNTNEQLVALFCNLKTWCKEDLGQDFELSSFAASFNKMTEEKLYAFISRRIGHLHAEDYFAFLSIMQSIENPPPPRVNQTQETPVEKEVIQKPYVPEVVISKVPPEDKKVIDKIQEVMKKPRGKSTKT